MIPDDHPAHRLGRRVALDTAIQIDAEPASQGQRRQAVPVFARQSYESDTARSRRFGNYPQRAMPRLCGTAFSCPQQAFGNFFVFPTIMQSTPRIGFFNAQVREVLTQEIQTIAPTNRRN